MDDDKTYEFGENLVQMISFFTYYCDHVHPGTWDLLRILFVCLDDWAYDYLSSFMTPLINFMARVSVMLCRYWYQHKVKLLLALF